MKLVHKICLGMLVAPISVFANIDCTKVSGTHDTCDCLASNAILDCKAASNNAPICNLVTVNNLAKSCQSKPATLIALCEQYRDKSTPDECSWGVSYYIKNTCWNQNIG
jgi:hypothetical protein